MRKHVRRMLLCGLPLIALANAGCIDGLMRNIWVGFGQSIGAFPANLAVSFAVDTFFGGMADNDNDNDNN